MAANLDYTDAENKFKCSNVLAKNVIKGTAYSTATQMVPFQKDS